MQQSSSVDGKHNGGAAIAINGRFLTQRVTGVQRFARETVLALDRLLQRPENAARRPQVELIVPPACTSRLPLTAIACRRAGRWKGYAWEQLELPQLAAGKVLLSLTGLGPLSVRRQLVVMHDVTYLAVPETFTFAVRAVYGFLVPHLIRRAQSVFAVSCFTRDEIGRRLDFSPAAIGICSEGGDHILAEAAEPGVLGRNGLAGRRYFLAVGTGGPNKNPEVLLDAFARGGLGGALLVLTGRRNERVHRKTRIEDSGAVRHTGYVTDGELRALYENAVALVFPSRYEGFGLPLVEAMTCGCPAIVAQQGALCEVSANKALHFPPDDPVQLHRLMQRVCSDEAFRQEAIARGRKRVAAFRWTNTAQILLDACLAL
jgi:glycosyltransferase involved in cell wall biosynthesis